MKVSRTGSLALLLMLAVAPGCGAQKEPAAVPQIELPRTPDSTMQARSVAEPAQPDTEATDPEAAALVGIWEDPETMSFTHFDIRIERGRPVLKSAGESRGDQEVYKVLSSTWENGTFSWTYFVPSTEYEVTINIVGTREDVLDITWSNDHGDSGKGELTRVVER